MNMVRGLQIGMHFTGGSPQCTKDSREWQRMCISPTILENGNSPHLLSQRKILHATGPTTLDLRFDTRRRPRRPLSWPLRKLEAVKR